MNARPHPPLPARRAFTLVEVVLALAIATALLVTALLFYGQATELRGHILRESERNTAIRLVLERLAIDLREAVAGQGDGGFSGGPESLSLVRPMAAEAGNAGLGLLRVSYSLVRSNEGTNNTVLGIDRREQPLRGVARPRTNLLFAAAFASDGTNFPAGAAANASATNAPRPAPPSLLSEDIRHLRFRYWDGAAWSSSWTNGGLPTGVEVVLGPEPLTDSPFAPDAETDAPPMAAADTGAAAGSPSVLFRRVVFVPAGAAVRHAADDGFTDPALP